VDWYDNAGHFIMLDQPERFHASVIDFLNNG
jgi:pimeloyl-ACP methyl ester carboxylesterase